MEQGRRGLRAHPHPNEASAAGAMLAVGKAPSRLEPCGMAKLMETLCENGVETSAKGSIAAEKEISFPSLREWCDSGSSCEWGGIETA